MYKLIYELEKVLQFSSPQHNDITKAVEYKNHTSSDSSHPASLRSDLSLIDLLGQESLPTSPRLPEIQTLSRIFQILSRVSGFVPAVQVQDRLGRLGLGRLSVWCRCRPTGHLLALFAHLELWKIVVIFMKNKL